MPEVRMGPDGGWAQAFCHYCGWASQARDMERAIKRNERHEKTHPEWTRPQTLEEIRAEIDAEHAEHECKPAPCACKCGCLEPLSCTVMFGPLCATCCVREMRGDDEHGEVEPAKSVGDASATVESSAEDPQDS